MSTEETNVDTLPSTEKHCAHPDCGKLLQQRPDEHPSKYKRRRHCNEKCSKSNRVVHKRQSDRATEARLKETRKCEQCEAKFHRGVGESRSVFLKRPTCSKACGALRRRAQTQEKILQDFKICENPDCKKKFYRRHRTETNVKFKKRKTCGQECGQVVRLAGHGWTKKERRPKPEVRKLPPVTPLAREIPDAPKPEITTIWRPESWGGPRQIKVS